MPTLLLRLAAPMQAWGTTSRFDERDSQLEPSKSGVLGLVCAALGRDRAEPVTDLAALRMGVRVDREGLLMRDYQTISGTIAASSEADKIVFKKHPVISPRYYLADAAFLVGLEGTDESLLNSIYAALLNPHWPLALGRKAFPPSLPAWLPDGLRDESLEQALTTFPRIAQPRSEHRDQSVRLMLEHPSEGAMRLDQPIAPFAERRFGPRYVKPGVINDVPEPTQA